MEMELEGDFVQVGLDRCEENSRQKTANMDNFIHYNGAIYFVPMYNWLYLSRNWFL